MPPHKSIYRDSSALQVNDNDDDDDGNDALEFGIWYAPATLQIRSRALLNASSGGGQGADFKGSLGAPASIHKEHILINNATMPGEKHINPNELFAKLSATHSFRHSLARECVYI